MSYWFSNERKLPQGRLNAFKYAIVAMALVLLWGFWNLQVIQSEQYAEMAERNRIRSIPILAARGRMLDRDGRVLVDNYPSFSVLLLRDDLAAVKRALPEISSGLEIPREDLEQQLDAAMKLSPFHPIIIRHEATPADLAFIESHRADIPVLELLMVHRRRYPMNGFLAHVAGYVGEASEQQIASSNGKYKPGDIVGKTGLERQYNDILMGKNGLRRAVVNSLGKEVGRLDLQEAEAGKPIRLTIDLDLQQAAENGMTGQKGAVVALDPRTGEILAMVSHPAPDPNLFSSRIPAEQWRRLNDDPDVPLLNRAIQAQLAPGSVFKIMMAVAMLESKVVPEDFTVYCNGFADFYGRTFRCHVWNKGGHGHVDLYKAIVQSCDIFFYNVGKRLGIDRISAFAKHLGLGRKTGVDLPGEEGGLVPSEEWKRRVFKEKWYAGETISVAIGQGALITTPLQLARSIGGIALGGVFKEPHLLLDAPQVREERFPLLSATIEKLTQAMYGVVNDGGTAGRARLEGIEFCGKTGTAQLISLEGMKRAGKTQRKLTDNAWFVGYAPRHNPEIVVAVLVEHGEHGSSAAAPIAREVIKTYYDKKGQREKQQFTVEYQRHDLDPALAAAVVAAPQRAKRVPATGEVPRRD